MSNLVKFAKNNGLDYDKKREVAITRKDGYYVILKELKAKKQIFMKLNLNAEDGVDINGFISNLENQNEFVEAATYKDYEALIIISGAKKQLFENVNIIMKKVTSFCSTNQVKNACLLCGTHSDLSVCGIGENVDIICRNCYSTAKIEIEEDLSKANFPKGLVGALLGSLIGVALWIVIYQLGYIAGLAGAAMVIFAFRGFKMFGKELTLAGAIASILISFFMVPLSVYICWSIELLPYMWEDATFSESFSSLIYLMAEEEDVLRGMVGEMVMGYFLYFVAAVSTITKTVKSAKLQHKTEVLVSR